MVRASRALFLIFLLLAGGSQAVYGQEGGSTRTLSVKELSHDTFQLSCIDTESCIAILRQLGYNTKPPEGTVKIEDLPAVFPMPHKIPKSVVGGGSSVAEKALNEETISAPQERLMIVYHGSQTEEVAKLKDLLDRTVDVPAKQVLIEGMVIELTEDAARELGAEWEIFGSKWRKTTFLPEEQQMPFIFSYDPAFIPSAALAGHVRATIRMIIEEGNAEILSSPSVLVLNNRNAKIQVVREVPVITTLISQATTELKVSFKTVGIILNIKPRISRDDTTVAMQILVEVSEAPQEDFIVVGEQSVAPLINRRVVETVARVRDNTPFIIGGLIRNEQVQAVDRVPIISRIPLLGLLFQRKVTRREKREVIIVLTPRVIKTAGTQRPVLPKDSARFDFLDNRLFRNSYRLKSEDMFELGFLENNPALLEAFDRTAAFVRKHPEYAQRSPFAEMAAGIIPGEDAVVIRMIYEIVKRLKLPEEIETANLLFFKEDPSKPAGFKVAYLSNSREPGRSVLGGDIQAYFDRPWPKEVLFLRYSLDTEEDLGKALQAPVAKVEWVEVKDRDEMEEHLLRINALGEDGRYHEFALAVESEKDLARLKAAITLREVAKVNNFEDLLTLRNFRAGRKIVIPTLAGEDGRMFLIDRTTAEFFFKSDYYYSALKARLERSYEIVEQALRYEINE